MIAFNRWPESFAARYREKGYWQDLPLTNLITRHADSDAIAIIDGDKQHSYRQFNQQVDNTASSLQRLGLKRGETALVQLGNVAESLHHPVCAVAYRSGAGECVIQPSAQRAECLRDAN